MIDLQKSGRPAGSLTNETTKSLIHVSVLCMRTGFPTFQNSCFSTDFMCWDEARVEVGAPLRVDIGKKVEATVDDDRLQNGEEG